MNRYAYAAMLFIFFLLLSCGGGKPVKKESDTSILATKILQKGIHAYHRGCFHSSLSDLTKAFELFTASDHLPGIAMSLNNMGNVYRFIGDAESALLFFDESYQVYSQLDDMEGKIQTLSNKAAILIQNGRLEEASDVIRMAESMARMTEKSYVHLLNNKGVLLTRKKDFVAAEEFLRQALDATTLDNLHEYATVNSSFGNLMIGKNDLKQALAYFEKALKADRKSGFYPGIADNLSEIGQVYFLQKQYEPAVNYLKRSINIYAILGSQAKVAGLMEMLEEASAAGNLDITLTRHFVEKWSRGDVLKHPCE